MACFFGDPSLETSHFEPWAERRPSACGEHSGMLGLNDSVLQSSGRLNPCKRRALLFLALEQDARWRQLGEKRGHQIGEETGLAQSLQRSKSLRGGTRLCPRRNRGVPNASTGCRGVAGGAPSWQAAEWALGAPQAPALGCSTPARQLPETARACQETPGSPMVAPWTLLRAEPCPGPGRRLSEGVTLWLGPPTQACSLVERGSWASRQGPSRESAGNRVAGECCSDEFPLQQSGRALEDEAWEGGSGSLASGPGAQNVLQHSESPCLDLSSEPQLQPLGESYYEKTRWEPEDTSTVAKTRSKVLGSRFGTPRRLHTF